MLRVLRIAHSGLWLSTLWADDAIYIDIASALPEHAAYDQGKTDKEKGQDCAEKEQENPKRHERYFSEAYFRPASQRSWALCMKWLA